MEREGGRRPRAVRASAPGLLVDPPEAREPDLEVVERPSRRRGRRPRGARGTTTTTSGVMPRPMTTPSAIRPASRSDFDAWALITIGMRRSPGPVEAGRAAVELRGTVAQQLAEREHVGLERRELRRSHAERPDTGAARADPDVRPARRELVHGRGRGRRDHGMARERVRHPRADAARGSSPRATAPIVTQGARKSAGESQMPMRS